MTTVSIETLQSTVQNMDCVDTSDLQALLDFAKDKPTDLIASKLFNGVTVSGRRVMRTMLSYAECSIKAREHRLAGRINDALKLEGVLVGLYHTLPECHQW